LQVKRDIVAAAADHQHKLQHLLILTEQHVMYAFLQRERCNCHQTFATTTPGGSASNSKKACAHGLQMSLYVMQLSGVFQSVPRLRFW